MGLSAIPAIPKTEDAKAGAKTGKAASGFLGMMISEVERDSASTSVGGESQPANSANTATPATPADKATSNESIPKAVQGVEIPPEEPGVAEHSLNVAVVAEPLGGEAFEGSPEEGEAPESPEASSEKDDARAAMAVAMDMPVASRQDGPIAEGVQVEDGEPQAASVPAARLDVQSGPDAAATATSGLNSDRQAALVKETEPSPASSNAAPDKAGGAVAVEVSVSGENLPQADQTIKSGIYVEVSAAPERTSPQPQVEAGQGVPSVESSKEIPPAQSHLGEVGQEVAAETLHAQAVSTEDTAPAIDAEAGEPDDSAESAGLLPEPSQGQKAGHRGHGPKARSGWKLWGTPAPDGKGGGARTATPEVSLPTPPKVRGPASKSTAIPAKAQVSADKAPEARKADGAKEKAAGPAREGESAKGYEADRLQSFPEAQKPVLTEAAPEIEGAGAALSNARPTEAAESKAAVAPEKPEAPQELRETREILRQVQGPLRVAFLQRGEKAVIQLMPEALGKVHVEISRTSQGMTANFRVETPEAKEALTTQIVQLKNGFEGRGVNLVSVNVELGNERSAGNGGQAGQQRKNKVQQRHLAGLEADAATAKGEAAWKPWGFETRA